MVQRALGSDPGQIITDEHLPEHLQGAGLSAIIVAEGDQRFSQIGTGSELLKYQRLVPTILTNFQPSHGWTLAGSANGVATTDHVFGEQALTLTAAAGSSASATRTGMPAINGTTHYARVWVKCDDMSKVVRFNMVASSDPAFGSFEAISIYINNVVEADRIYKSGEWVCVEFPWADVATTGTPNRAALTAFRFLAYADTGAPVTVKVNRIEYVPRAAAFPNGVISLSFDDSFAEHYTVARKRMSLYGMAGTLFPIIDRLDTAGYLTTAQVDELAFIHSWEIAGHATSMTKHVQSLTGMTSDERRTELKAIRAWQQSRGYQSYTFAYPNGKFNAEALADLQQFFSQSRCSLAQGSQVQVPILPHRIKASNANASLAGLKAVVDTLAGNGRWFNIMFHDIVTSGGTASKMTVADFDALIDHIAASGVPVRTMGEVLRANAA